jgi:hypothetical protein
MAIAVPLKFPVGDPETFQDTDEGPADPNRKSYRMKMIGKPYSGKLNVRFDEGELEIEPRLLRQFPALPLCD